MGTGIRLAWRKTTFSPKKLLDLDWSQRIVTTNPDWVTAQYTDTNRNSQFACTNGYVKTPFNVRYTPSISARLILYSRRLNNESRIRVGYASNFGPLHKHTNFSRKYTPSTIWWLYYIFSSLYTGKTPGWLKCTLQSNPGKHPIWRLAQPYTLSHRSGR